MKKNLSSFKELPPQIEWSLPFMIALIVYIWVLQRGYCLDFVYSYFCHNGKWLDIF